MEPIRIALLAVDLTARSELVIRAARRVLPDRSVDLILLHVVSDLESLLDIYGGEGSVDSLQAGIANTAERKLDELLREHLSDYPSAHAELRKGPISSEIVAAAIANRADLIFIGSHFTDLPKHKTTGDIVTKVTRISPCAVVVVPSDEE